MRRPVNDEHSEARPRVSVMDDHKCPRIPPVLYAGLLAVGSAIATVAMLKFGAALF